MITPWRWLLLLAFVITAHVPCHQAPCPGNPKPPVTDTGR